MLTAEQIAPKRAVPILRTTYHQLGALGVHEGRRVPWSTLLTSTGVAGLSLRLGDILAA